MKNKAEYIAYHSYQKYLITAKKVIITIYSILTRKPLNHYYYKRMNF
jgi:hypothetical protein